MKKLAMLSISILLVLATSCRSAKPGPMAMAVLHPTSGTHAVGMVHFQENADGSVGAFQATSTLRSGLLR